MRNFAQLEDEIQRVDSETASKVASRLAQRRSTVFKAPLVLPKKNKSNGKKLSDVKLAFSEFYLSLILLQNYQASYIFVLGTINPHKNHNNTVFFNILWS